MSFYYGKVGLLTKLRHRLIKLVAGDTVVILNAKIEAYIPEDLEDAPLLTIKSDRVMLCNVWLDLEKPECAVNLSRWG